MPFFLGGGANVGVVISIMGMDTLGGGEGLHIDTISYDLVGPNGSTTTLDFCDTLGTPPVVVTIVTTGDDPDPNAGEVAQGTASVLVSCDSLILGDSMGLLGSTADVSVSLDNCSTVDAVSIALTYDAGIVTPTGGVASGAAAGAEFFEVGSNTSSGEMTAVLIMEADGMPGTPSIPPAPGPGGQNIMTLSFSSDTVGSTALTLTDGLGSPPTDNILVVGGLATTPLKVNGSINVVNFNLFQRGDCNQDGNGTNIADGIFLLNHLFQGGPESSCEDACDLNDDSMLDATDAIYVFNYRFLAGPPPAAPFPDEGIDPTTGDGIGCNGDADDPQDP